MSAMPEIFEFTNEFKESLYNKHIEFVRMSERLEFYEEKAVEHELKMSGLYAADDETLIEDLFAGGNTNPWEAKIKEVLAGLPESPTCYDEYLSMQSCVLELKIEDELGLSKELLAKLYNVEAHIFNVSLSRQQVAEAAAAGISPVIAGTVEDFVCDLANVAAFADAELALSDTIAMAEAAVSLGLLQLAEQENNLE